MLAASLWQSVFGMPQIAVIMGCMIPIAAIGFSFWFKAQKVQSDHRLKRLMLERGMNAEEIERIISAGTKHEESD